MFYLLKKKVSLFGENIVTGNTFSPLLLYLETKEQYVGI
jgi:hypothetical protein